MITVRLELPDATYEQFEEEAQRVRQPLERVITNRVLTVGQIPTGARVILLTGETLDQLEQILGGGSILNAEDLLKKVERLAGISFVHLRLPFSPSQLEQLQEKARRQGLTVEQLVHRTAPRVYEQFFDLVARV